MIGFLRGKLAAKHPPALLLDVNGVGYEVEAPMSTFYGLPGVGAEVGLHTHLVVREDAHVLFGFGTERERSLFRELIKVSGVGPRIALGILSGATVDEFHRCVETQDTAALTRIPGIGRKTAERLIVEMRDRLKALGSGTPFEVKGPIGGGAQAAPNPHAEAFSALVALGYKPPEVTRLLQKVDASVTTTEELIRHALRAASA
ncbi:MAG TPA: Holliday junction branch migration protein RuvA, partial [Steroidobacteraceae bacterium]|nr:Holliday junction branch migration protein RuvA [Steroidobacteraceae bacterium]